MQFTHLNSQGRARMVDVSEKAETTREALAEGIISIKRDTLRRIMEGSMKKGDVLSVAQVGGIMAAKNTAQIIPMCHPVYITGCDISFEIDMENCRIIIRALCKTYGKTGVEMEALTAVSAASLTVYDMCKAVDKEITIESIRLISKSGGKSGDFERGEMKWEGL
jgi:cyclic pyranopterin phosphate synthase